MDNSRVQNIQKSGVEQLPVREGLAMAAGAEGQNFGAQIERGEVAPDVARERAQAMGWQVLDGGNNGLTDNAERVAAEIVDFEAAQEIARDQAELEHPVEFVGDETPLQTAERLEDQQENSLNEIDPKRDFEAKIATQGQEKIARVAMDEVEKLVRAKRMYPKKIVEIWRKRGDAVLNSYENPHPIGKGN